MVSSTFAVNEVSEGARSATPSSHGPPGFTRVAGMTSRSENFFMPSGADPTPSLASSSSESSQQDGEQQLRKSCDYCVRMKRGCDGGTPCELCSRRNKYCIRSVKKRSGPAKGTKYCKRRARNKKSPMNRSEQTANIGSPMSSTSCGGRRGRSMSEDPDNDGEDRDDPTGIQVSTATIVAKSVASESIAGRSINASSMGRADAPDLAGSAKVELSIAKSGSPDAAPGNAAPGVNQSHSRWQQHCVEPGVGQGSCIPISYPSEKSVDSASRTLLSRGSANDNVLTQSAARVAVGRRGGLEQPSYATYCRRSSINALLETGEMDMDRKDRKDKTSFVWSSRIHGDTPGSEGLRPASLSVTMGMPTPGTPFAGALFRTTGVPFVDPRAAHVAVPPPGLANSSDPPRELSLGELLLEKWPPAPISELTTTETS